MKVTYGYEIFNPKFFPFSPESSIDIEALDIPVNAVATALKDFFSKHLPPLFDKDLMSELEEIAGKYNKLLKLLPNFDLQHKTFQRPPACISSSRGLPSTTLNMEVKTDRSCRLLALRSLLNKLPPYNFSILKYIFQHFVR